MFGIKIPLRLLVWAMIKAKFVYLLVMSSSAPPVVQSVGIHTTSRSDGINGKRGKGKGKPIFLQRTRWKIKASMHNWRDESNLFLGWMECTCFVCICISSPKFTHTKRVEPLLFIFLKEKKEVPSAQYIFLISTCVQAINFSAEWLILIVFNVLWL